MKVLHLAHNHPDYHAGGTEIFAKALSEEQNQRDGWDARFIGAALANYRQPNAGTPFVADDYGRGDVVVRSRGFERLTLSQLDAMGTLHQLGEFFAAEQPDVIHVHHVLLLGLEVLAVARRSAPQAKIVLTLHDFYPMCHNDGLMIRTQTHALCDHASASRCARCFPDVGLANFRLRELFVKNAFQQVDAFVAPSRFLADRYISWGLPADRVHHIRNGYPRQEWGESDTEQPANGERPVVFGFFGHLNTAKGARVALRAASMLAEEGYDFRLRLHGSDAYADEEAQTEIAKQLTTLGRSAEHRGAYERGNLPRLMQGCDWILVPSIWWENDPLVINEAALNRRPVICSNIGGMAEKVIDGVTGLHALPNDTHSLADVMRRAMEEPDLARQLGGNAPDVPTMAACGDAYAGLYHSLAA